MESNSKIREFTQLVKKHQGIIIKVSRLYCSNEDCRKDLVQDILLQLWRSFPSFNNQAKFSTWMYRVALNTAISQLRSDKKHSASYNSALPDLISDDNIEIDKEEKIRTLYRAIGKLSLAEKSIIMLYLEDCQYSEISDILGITVSNVGVKINRIKSKLHNILKEMGYED